MGVGVGASASPASGLVSVQSPLINTVHCSIGVAVGVGEQDALGMGIGVGNAPWQKPVKAKKSSGNTR